MSDEYLIERMERAFLAGQRNGLRYAPGARRRLEAMCRKLQGVHRLEAVVLMARELRAEVIGPATEFVPWLAPWARHEEGSGKPAE